MLAKIAHNIHQWAMTWPYNLNRDNLRPSVPNTFFIIQPNVKV